jgi:uncharacterized protein YyaL (SSP411 family)
MLKILRTEFIPNKVVLLRPTAEENPPITQIAAYTRYQKSQNHQATAYVCRNQNCQAPTTDPAQMLDRLKPPIITD